MNKRILLTLILLGAAIQISAMQQNQLRSSSNNIEEIKDNAGIISYRDLNSGFWVRYFPDRNFYQGKITNNIWEGTYDDEGNLIQASQNELRNFYNSLRSNYKLKTLAR
jgi:hypothetical protein